MRMTISARRLGCMAFMAVGVVVGWGGLASADEHSKASKAQVCEVAKLAAVGEKAECLAEEAADAVLGRTPNFAKCEDKFTKAFAKAEQHAGPGVCPTEGDAAAIEATVDACVAGIAFALTASHPPSCRQFPATGQTTAYGADKNDGISGPVAVPDDGTVQAGAPLSYLDNGDGTITDLNTGLMWEMKDTLGGLHDVGNVYRWSGNGSLETIWDWLDLVNTENGIGFAGHTDWRIPNVKELQSIVDYGRSGPSIDPVFGPAASGYWASSSSVFNPASRGTSASTAVT